ncbi:hypothetical protein HanXRQr2_Chr09g0396471 [Helianthus annuus]|uniref:Uncharacterized protein n=1 Tax=Helianthus annuus TaxID=4232 RepID=A0A251T3L4_HELAN|nr:hypothetical protein HanXRQr2_Chr09g0396471 [Helianthus annuus]KAJ0526628.1 hypothetical protein HanHA300_Chr09g0325331 [Helianthus annuus]KAJ0543021.1 hypothetical protein HanHA89_Chr09g0346241 [Helianthus annuus]KAJ0708076.1 hypothetical protein HanLR1_Chr09g0325571 [Helianthus annuus]KAJ0893832.1 hypothetical protein HanPSC8_Chr09g0382241 [Helianthus annuus]
MGVVPIPSSSGDEPPSTPPPSVIVLIVEMSPFATNQSGPVKVEEEATKKRCTEEKEAMK